MDTNEGVSQAAEEAAVDEGLTDAGGGSGSDQDQALGGELEKWKRRSREMERKAKSHAEKAKQYDQLVESQKTETQKLTEARDAAEKARAAQDSELAVMRAAVKYKLEPEDVDLLEGVPADQVDERAKKLSDRLGARSNAGTFPDLGQGRGSASTGKETDMNSMIRRAAGGRAG